MLYGLAEEILSVSNTRCMLCRWRYSVSIPTRTRWRLGCHWSSSNYIFSGHYFSYHVYQFHFTFVIGGLQVLGQKLIVTFTVFIRWEEERKCLAKNGIWTFRTISMRFLRVIPSWRGPWKVLLQRGNKN